MMVSFTKLAKAIVLSIICLTSLTSSFAQNISIANGCLSGYMLAYEAPDQNGKKYFGSTNTQTIIFGGVTYPDQNISVFWAVTGDNIGIGGSTIANNKWVAVITGGNDAVLYHPTATGDLPPSTGWVSNTTKSCTNATQTIMTGTGVTLSVELTQFNATTEGSKNHLTWTTASEENNKHFDIERSIDGNTFQSIAQVKGNNKPSSYQYTDNQPFSTTYYRLKQVDYDGTATYSKVISVTYKGGKSLKVYPTLVSNGFLTVDSEVSDYAIYNIVGQQVQSGKTAQRLDVSALAKGTYILKVGTEQAKFVKQ